MKYTPVGRKNSATLPKINWGAARNDGIRERYIRVYSCLISDEIFMKFSGSQTETNINLFWVMALMYGIYFLRNTDGRVSIKYV